MSAKPIQDNLRTVRIEDDNGDLRLEVMAVCTYDNPATMARECWQDGKLICYYACQLLPPYTKEPIPDEHFFFGANIGPWKPGQMVGDAEAMSSNGLAKPPGAALCDRSA
jgi:hypothetical protein